jgi:hypothetical protein
MCKEKETAHCTTGCDIRFHQRSPTSSSVRGILSFHERQLKWSPTFYGLRRGLISRGSPWIERGGGTCDVTGFLNGYFSENGFPEESRAVHPPERHKTKSNVGIHGKVVFLINKRNDGISANFPHQIE